MQQHYKTMKQPYTLSYFRQLEMQAGLFYNSYYFSYRFFPALFKYNISIEESNQIYSLRTITTVKHAQMQQNLFSIVSSQKEHKFEKPGQRVTTKFCTETRNIFGFSAQNLFSITFLGLRILRCLVTFWKICASLWSSAFFYAAFFLALFPSRFCPFFLSFFFPMFHILFKIVNCYSVGGSNIPACNLITLTPKTF